jgi:site-specific recombinase XerD
LAVTKRPKGNGVVWSVDVRVNGRRIRKTVGSKREAEIIEARIKADARAERWDLKKPEELSFRDVVERYLEYMELNRARSTYRNEKYRIEANLVPFFGDMLLRSVEYEDVEEYKAMRLGHGVSLNTINHELTNLSHIFRMAIQWGYADRNVMASVERFKLTRTTPGYLSEREVGKLLEAASGTYIYPILVTALHTGMRRAELFNLQWADVDFTQGTVTIQGKADWHTKNYKARTMQMTPTLESTLHEVWRSDSRCEYVFHNNGERRKYIDGTLRSVCKHAGLEGVTLHTLRHTFASHLVLAGVTLREVQELMGHQSYETTLRYAHLSSEHVKKQVMRLPFAGEKEIKPVRVLKAAGEEV